ncbi:hypothetical protein, partial [Mesorhizobium sp.]|uniref:hypothetical protein n=1 Tax=Mesorhizobium sp. TaxID=1871066 RepID=UPI0025CED6F2
LHRRQNRQRCSLQFFAERRHTVMVVQHQPAHKTIADSFLQLAQSPKVLRNRCGGLHLDTDDPTASTLDHDADLVLILGPVV